MVRVLFPFRMKDMIVFQYLRSLPLNRNWSIRKINTEPSNARNIVRLNTHYTTEYVEFHFPLILGRLPINHDSDTVVQQINILSTVWAQTRTMISDVLAAPKLVLALNRVITVQISRIRRTVSPLPLHTGTSGIPRCKNLTKSVPSHILPSGVGLWELQDDWSWISQI